MDIAEHTVLLMVFKEIRRIVPHTLISVVTSL